MRTLLRLPGHGPDPACRTGVAAATAATTARGWSPRALMRRGSSAEAAIRLLRERRSPRALHNDLFVECLRAGPATARLLEEPTE